MCFTSALSAKVLCIPSAERAVGDGERMLDVLQRWGQHRAEVRFFLRHNRAPSRDSGKCPSPCTSPHMQQIMKQKRGLLLSHTSHGLDKSSPQRKDIWHRLSKLQRCLQSLNIHSLEVIQEWKFSLTACFEAENEPDHLSSLHYRGLENVL